MASGEEPKTGLQEQIASLRQSLRDLSGLPKPSRLEFLTRAPQIAVIIATMIVAVWMAVSREGREALLHRLVRSDPTTRASTITFRDVPEAPPAISPQNPAEGALAAAREPPRSFERAEPASPREASRPGRPSAVPDLPEAPAAPAEPVPPKPSEVELQAPPAGEPSKGPAEPQVSPEAAGAAYELVLSQHDRMRQLASQGQSRWRVVKVDGDAVWVDIIIAAGREEHYIWKVDVRRQAVEALSQAARNLER